MGCVVEWYDEAHTVLVLRATPPLVWSEVETAFLESIALTERADHGVYVIYDSTQIHQMPHVPNPLARMKALIEKKPKNLRLLILVGGSSLAQTFVSILDRVLQLEWVAQVASLDEAHALIASRTGQ